MVEAAAKVRENIFRDSAKFFHRFQSIWILLIHIAGDVTACVDGNRDLAAADSTDEQFTVIDPRLELVGLAVDRSPCGHLHLITDLEGVGRNRLGGLGVGGFNGLGAEVRSNLGCQITQTLVQPVAGAALVGEPTMDGDDHLICLRLVPCD